MRPALHSVVKKKKNTANEESAAISLVNTDTKSSTKFCQTDSISCIRKDGIHDQAGFSHYTRMIQRQINQCETHKYKWLKN